MTYKSKLGNPFHAFLKQFKEMGGDISRCVYDPFTKTTAIYLNLDKVTAQMLLDLNIRHNRKMARNNQEHMIDDMNSGNWLFIGDTVRINVKGRLFDAQNRLKSFIRSRLKMLTFLVIDGLPEKAVIHTDTGKKRNLQSINEIDGYVENSRWFTAVLTILYFASVGKLYDASNRKPHQDDILAYRDKHAKNLLDLANKAKAGWKTAIADTLGNPLLSEAEYIRFYGLFASISNWETAEQFLYKVITGLGVTTKSPAYLFKQKLMVLSGENRYERRRLSNGQLNRYIVRSFLAFSNGLNISETEWDTELPKLTPFKTLK